MSWQLIEPERWRLNGSEEKHLLLQSSTMPAIFIELHYTTVHKYEQQAGVEVDQEWPLNNAVYVRTFLNAVDELLGEKDSFSMMEQYIEQ